MRSQYFHHHLSNWRYVLHGGWGPLLSPFFVMDFSQRWLVNNLERREGKFGVVVDHLWRTEGRGAQEWRFI